MCAGTGGGGGGGREGVFHVFGDGEKNSTEGVEKKKNPIGRRKEKKERKKDGVIGYVV